LDTGGIISLRSSSVTRKPRFRNVGAGKGVKEQLTEPALRRLYVEQRLTQSAIARRFGCTPQFVSLLVAEYGLQRSPGREESTTDQGE
jgi:hypothetical protein